MLVFCGRKQRYRSIGLFLKEKEGAARFLKTSNILLSNLYSTSLQFYLMPKYVPKEDVEKGLVDPTKPLAEQVEYKQKIDQEAQAKQKQQEQKNPQHQRPKKERPPRNERPKFNWNKKDITLETKAPEKPKKILEKPDKEKFNEAVQKLKDQRQVFNKERRALIEEQKALIRDVNESKKTGKMAITQFSGAMKEKFNLENQLRKQIRALDDQKKKVSAELDGYKSRISELRKPTSSAGESLERLREKIEDKEHRLTTSDINKREEGKLFTEINELKRALQKARPSIEIESELSKLEDQQTILYKELKAIKHELHIKITEANAIKEELDGLRKQKESEQGQVKEQRTVESIKAEYDEKIKALDLRRDKLEDQIDDAYDRWTRDNDSYEDQVDLLKYIKWVEGEVEWLNKKKEEEEKRKKEQEEYEKRRLKEKEDYEKRKEERKKQDEERKQKEEERKARQEKEREAYINRNPNHQLVDLCENLISYLEGLKPVAKYEAKQVKPVGEIKFGKEWAKQIKGGAVVIASKKSNLDEEPKKAQKPKKKEEKPEDDTLTHGIDTIGHFQTIKLLPPTAVPQIDSTIQLIKEKLAFYQNPTEEEKAAFREKATKEFDERHGPRENKERDYKQRREEEAPAVEKAEKPRRQENKKKLTEQDFPGLA